MPYLTRLFACLALGLFAAVAEAHALLISTTVEGHDVVLHYNGRIDASRSRLSLLNPAGGEPKPLECVAGSDPATLKGKLGDTAPGAYVLRWEVLSIDGHISRGDQTVTIPAP